MNFELDPRSVAVLRRFKGFEDYDPYYEVLGNTKPGTGGVDAPQCFGIKLDMAFKKFGSISAVYDKHL